MRRTITLSAVAALVCAAVGVTIAGASSPARDDHGGVEVIHVVEETPPGGNVSLDLDRSGGAPPDTVGDELVFKADLLVGGRKVGFNGGLCKLVGLPASAKGTGHITSRSPAARAGIARHVARSSSC